MPLLSSPPPYTHGIDATKKIFLAIFPFFLLVFFLCITRETILSNFDLFEQVEESLQLLFHRCCNNYSRLFKENVSNRRRRGTLGRKFSSSVEYILNIIETKIVFFHYSSTSSTIYLHNEIFSNTLNFQKVNLHHVIRLKNRLTNNSSFPGLDNSIEKGLEEIRKYFSYRYSSLWIKLSRNVV